ncbi:hypothetical protein KEM48_006052 [Puccinia striiformis f. sp. tritici PST-130]|nr:hypothetical protein KEM48_006052 [Puccinia striiformis f. sp. tritici PST-130]
MAASYKALGSIPILDDENWHESRRLQLDLCSLESGATKPDMLTAAKIPSRKIYGMSFTTEIYDATNLFS